jgi:hypothetical protein
MERRRKEDEELASFIIFLIFIGVIFALSAPVCLSRDKCRSIIIVGVVVAILLGSVATVFTAGRWSVKQTQPTTIEAMSE